MKTVQLKIREQGTTALVDIPAYFIKGGLAIHRGYCVPFKKGKANKYVVTHTTSGLSVYPGYLSCKHARELLTRLLSLPINWYQSEKSVCRYKAEIMTVIQQFKYERGL